MLSLLKTVNQKNICFMRYEQKCFMEIKYQNLKEKYIKVDDIIHS
jgi:hypothetical protein